jgi:hypothetical protein
MGAVAKCKELGSARARTRGEKQFAIECTRHVLRFRSGAQLLLPVQSRPCDNINPIAAAETPQNPISQLQYATIKRQKTSPTNHHSQFLISLIWLKGLHNFFSKKVVLAPTAIDFASEEEKRVNSEHYLVLDKYENKTKAVPPFVYTLEWEGPTSKQKFSRLDHLSKQSNENNARKQKGLPSVRVCHPLLFFFFPPELRKN